MMFISSIQKIKCLFTSLIYKTLKAMNVKEPDFIMAVVTNVKAFTLIRFSSESRSEWSLNASQTSFQWCCKCCLKSQAVDISPYCQNTSPEMFFFIYILFIYLTRSFQSAVSLNSGGWRIKKCFLQSQFIEMDRNLFLFNIPHRFSNTSWQFCLCVFLSSLFSYCSYFSNTYSCIRNQWFCKC